MSDNAILGAEDGFARTIAALQLLLGRATTEQPIGLYTKFGLYGYTVQVYGSHLDYLSAVNCVVSPLLPEFDADTLERWRLMNDLAMGSFTRGVPDQDRIARHQAALAALVGFPTLEELARRVCGRWDEDGRPTRDIPFSEGIVTRALDGIEGRRV